MPTRILTVVLSALAAMLITLASPLAGTAAAAQAMSICDSGTNWPDLTTCR